MSDALRDPLASDRPGELVRELAHARTIADDCFARDQAAVGAR